MKTFEIGEYLVYEEEIYLIKEKEHVKYLKVFDEPKEPNGRFVCETNYSGVGSTQLYYESKGHKVVVSEEFDRYLLIGIFYPHIRLSVNKYDIIKFPDKKEIFFRLLTNEERKLLLMQNTNEISRQNSNDLIAKLDKIAELIK